jgi:HicA toxin of bacterial toxin-antitoxin,
VNNAQRATLERVFADPVNGNLAWSKIEFLLKAVGCTVVEGKGSAVTFEHGGRKLTLHRPHPGKEALRYRVLAVREFLNRLGVSP